MALTKRGTTIKTVGKMCLCLRRIQFTSIGTVPIAANTAHWKYVFTKAKSICFLYDTRLRFRERTRHRQGGANGLCNDLLGDNQKDFMRYLLNTEHGGYSEFDWRKDWRRQHVLKLF